MTTAISALNIQSPKPVLSQSSPMLARSAAIAC
jgi:hypothetical protein